MTAADDHTVIAAAMHVSGNGSGPALRNLWISMNCGWGMVALGWGNDATDPNVEDESDAECWPLPGFVFRQEQPMMNAVLPQQRLTLTIAASIAGVAVFWMTETPFGLLAPVAAFHLLARGRIVTTAFLGEFG